MNDEKMRVFIEVALAEYSALRAELRETIAKQFKVISTTFTLLASLFTAGATLISSNVQTKPTFMSLLFYVIIPCFSMFSGILWLDYVYRQVKIGAYISLVETKLNAMFVKSEELQDVTKCPMFWEHYADEEAHRSFLLKSNHWNYYFSMALYIGLPLVSIGYFKVVEHGQWYSWCWVTALVLLCFATFLIGYITVINKNIKEINAVSLWKGGTKGAPSMHGEVRGDSEPCEENKKQDA